MFDGISEVFKILAEKVSRKAAVIMTAMFLVYLLSVTPAAVSVIFCVAIITFLSIFFTVIQALIDRKNIERLDKKDGLVEK